MFSRVGVSNYVIDFTSSTGKYIFSLTYSGSRGLNEIVAGQERGSETRGGHLQQSAPVFVVI